MIRGALQYTVPLAARLVFRGRALGGCSSTDARVSDWATTLPENGLMCHLTPLGLAPPSFTARDDARIDRLSETRDDVEGHVVSVDLSGHEGQVRIESLRR